MRGAGWLGAVGSWLALSACGGRSVEYTVSDSGAASDSAAPASVSRNCAGLAPTCGPHHDDDCCASSVLPAGTFFRGYDGQQNLDQSYPAKVSEFRLDNYEITVGRFRRFAAIYARYIIPPGAGKNPNDHTDPGWDPRWNASLPGDWKALEAKLTAYGPYATWSSTAGSAAAESLPITSLNWFEAQAFCIWDGGRLPTEAEWNYAAAGGDEQRVYPWGNSAPGADTNLAVYNCYQGNPAGISSCSGATNLAPVGSVAAGNGKWGQADLAGNVAEWVQDYYATPYSDPCANCADLTNDSAYNVIRGGGFDDNATNLTASVRNYNDPADHYKDQGARCARDP